MFLKFLEKTEAKEMTTHPFFLIYESGPQSLKTFYIT